LGDTRRWEIRHTIPSQAEVHFRWWRKFPISWRLPGVMFLTDDEKSPFLTQSAVISDRWHWPCRAVRGSLGQPSVAQGPTAV